MGIFRSIAGMLTVEIVSADIPGMLAAMAEQDIPVFDVKTKGELTLQLRINRRDYGIVFSLCERRGECLRILDRRGIYWTIKALLKRPLLLVGAALILGLMLYLPTRVLFIRVEGNVNVPTNQILEAAAQSGIRFGASRSEVRSERMKNALLEELPQLQWAGVNTSGCLAVISVRERTDAAIEKDRTGVSSIVAVCDGIILSTTVTSGNRLCQPGQAVTKGQVLISGYTDVGLCIQATRAEGEIFARTKRILAAVTPAAALQRGERGVETVKYGLIVGKKRINLWKGSGIWEGSCGRMYEEYYITLPGGFQLPIALVKETVTFYDTKTVPIELETAESGLIQFAESYLRQQMISGTITDQTTEITEGQGVYVLEGEYFCTEMIGRVRQEKIGE